MEDALHVGKKVLFVKFHLFLLSAGKIPQLF